MHAFSIATALLDVLREHVPAGARLRTVQLRAGPLQMIDDQAMQLAWEAATSGSDLEGSAIAIEYLPWQWSCTACGRHWRSIDLQVACACGEGPPRPNGSNELNIMSIEVDEPDTGGPDRTSAITVNKQSPPTRRPSAGDAP